MDFDNDNIDTARSDDVEIARYRAKEAEHNASAAKVRANRIAETLQLAILYLVLGGIFVALVLQKDHSALGAYAGGIVTLGVIGTFIIL